MENEELEYAGEADGTLARRESKIIWKRHHMRLVLICFFLLALHSITQAQQIDLIANTEGRTTISLDGQWRTIIDPYESGYYDYRYQPSANGYFKDAKPKSKSDLIEYDFDSSASLKVPGDWNTQDDHLLFYEGTIWYKKAFDYKRKDNTRLFLYFGAANYIADVYLNGQKLGRHEGGFTPFNFEITNLVRDTNNSLIVKVDNKRRRDAVPTLITDWWNYGGLTRQVKLVETPITFVQDYLIQLQKGSQQRIAGWVKLNGGKTSQKISIRIPEARLSKSFSTDADGFARIEFDFLFEQFAIPLHDGAELLPIELVAGEDLVKLFEDLELGLVPKRTFDVDRKFFDEFGKGT